MEAIAVSSSETVRLDETDMARLSAHGLDLPTAVSRALARGRQRCTTQEAAFTRNPEFACRLEAGSTEDTATFSCASEEGQSRCHRAPERVGQAAIELMEPVFLTSE